jgi:hypothetical protein
MRPLLTCFVVTSLALTGLMWAGASQGQDKKTDAIRHKVDAHDLAVEFQTDAKAARQKYAAKGETIEVIGLVTSLNSRTRTITLDTGTKVAIVLQAKKIVDPDEKSKQVAARATGRFKSFEKNAIIIECQEVALLRVVGDVKK